MQESYGGEDAFFISKAGGGAFGVADGVGGWQDSGINPAGLSLSLSSWLPIPLKSRSCFPWWLSELTVGMVHLVAEYSRTFMRLACHYLESKSIHPVDASELPVEGAAANGPVASDASSATMEGL